MRVSTCQGPNFVPGCLQCRTGIGLHDEEMAGVGLVLFDGLVEATFLGLVGSIFDVLVGAS